MTRRNNTASVTTQEVLNLYPQVTIYNYRYVDSVTYIIMVQPHISFTDSDASGIVYEQVEYVFGINYKFNGLLHHNLGRVWVITKIAIPKLEDIHFPDINFDPDCKFTRKLNNARQAAKYEIQSICKSMKPLNSLLKQKERHYENAIKALLKEEIPRSLHESGHSQSSRSNQVPVSAGQRFLHDTTEGEMPVPVCKKRAAPALILL